MTNGKENIKAYFAYAAVCFFWGTTYLAIKVGVTQLPPFLFAGLRWFFAGLIFLIFLLFKGHKIPRPADLAKLAVVAIFLIGIGNGMLTFAEQWVPSGMASLFITTIPFWIVGMETMLPSGPKANLRIVFGLVLGLVGVVLILGHDWKHLLDNTYLKGLFGLLVLVVSWAFGSVYSKYKNVNVHPLLGAALQMTIAGFAQICAGLIMGESSRFHFDEKSFLAFSYLLVFGALVGYSSYIYALTHLPLSFVSTYAYINPVIALFLGWLVLGEEMSWLIVAAAVIIFAGVAVVKSGAAQQKRVILKRSIVPEDNTT